LRRTAAVIGCATIAGVSFPVLAQRPMPTPEQRIERLERQLDQVQRQVFPRGRPADTAGFSTEPAATQSSVATLNQRLSSLELQMSQLLRQSEENRHRLQTFEADLAKVRSDSDQRFGAIEQRISEAATISVSTPVQAAPPPAPPGKPVRAAVQKPTPPSAQDSPPADGAAAADPGEDAYSEGFHLWEAGRYDAAIASLRSFTSAYPKHRRVSFAKNLIGRALLDKGQPEQAAAALLANYRSDPQGERAADSLYYLGQAEMKLGQPGQACKAYAELDAVYGSRVRADLAKLVTDAKADANCR
jgi:TolA-binding protein